MKDTNRMGRRIRITLALLLLALAVWQGSQQYGQMRPGTALEASQAERQLRAFVMTQDIEYLRSQLIDLHKTHWQMRKDAEPTLRIGFWCWAGVAGIALGVMFSDLIRRKRA